MLISNNDIYPYILRNFMNHDEIHKLCKDFDITDYVINSDDSIDVNQSVYMA